MELRRLDELHGREMNEWPRPLEFRFAARELHDEIEYRRSAEMRAKTCSMPPPGVILANHFQVNGLLWRSVSGRSTSPVEDSTKPRIPAIRPPFAKRRKACGRRPFRKIHHRGVVAGRDGARTGFSVWGRPSRRREEAGRFPASCGSVPRRVGVADVQRDFGLLAEHGQPSLLVGLPAGGFEGAFREIRRGIAHRFVRIGGACDEPQAEPLVGVACGGLPCSSPRIR